MKTKNLFLALIIMAGMLLITVPASQAQTCDSTGTNFVDLNGDGFNDNAPDHDGDGIPNGLDPDYIKNAKDGTGNMYKKGQMNQNLNQGLTQNKKMNKFQKGNKFQKANSYKFQNRINQTSGTNGQGTGICDGSGPNGGSGVCDGTGPYGPKGRK